MGWEQLREPARLLERRAGRQPGLRDRRVARRVDGDDLLDGERRAFVQPDAPVVGDEARRLVHAGRVRQGPAVDHDPGARGLGDERARLPGLHLDVEQPVAQISLFDGHEVVASQTAVAGDPGVRDGAVECRAQLERTRPVLADDRDLHGGQVGLGHVDEPPLRHPGHPPGGVAGSHDPREHPAAEVQLLCVAEQLEAADVEPGAVADPEGQRQPVGHVDEILVVDRSPRDLGDQAVVAPRHVRAGVVDVVGPGLGRRPPRREIAVAEGAQGLSQALGVWIESVVAQRPARVAAVAVLVVDVRGVVPSGGHLANPPFREWTVVRAGRRLHERRRRARRASRARHLGSP